MVRIPMPSHPLPHRLLRNHPLNFSGPDRPKSQIHTKTPQEPQPRVWVLVTCRARVIRTTHTHSPLTPLGQDWCPHKESTGLPFPGSPLCQPLRLLMQRIPMPSLSTPQDHARGVRVREATWEGDSREKCIQEWGIISALLTHPPPSRAPWDSLYPVQLQNSTEWLVNRAFGIHSDLRARPPRSL